MKSFIDHVHTGVSAVSSEENLRSEVTTISPDRSYLDPLRSEFQRSIDAAFAALADPTLIDDIQGIGAPETPNAPMPLPSHHGFLRGGTFQRRNERKASTGRNAEVLEQRTLMSGTDLAPGTVALEGRAPEVTAHAESAETLTPHFTVSVSPDNRGIRLAYENVESATLRFDLIKDGVRLLNTTLASKRIPAGSGTLPIPISMGDTTGIECVIVIEATGVPISPYVKGAISGGTVTEAPVGSFPLPSLAYPAPKASPAATPAIVSDAPPQSSTPTQAVLDAVFSNPNVLQDITTTSSSTLAATPEEVETLTPTFTLSVSDDHRQILLTYENVENANLRFDLIKDGVRLLNTTLASKRIPAGSGILPLDISMGDTTGIECVIVIEATGVPISPYVKGAISGGTVTEDPVGKFGLPDYAWTRTSVVPSVPTPTSSIPTSSIAPVVPSVVSDPASVVSVTPSTPTAVATAVALPPAPETPSTPAPSTEDAQRLALQASFRAAAALQDQYQFYRNGGEGSYLDSQTIPGSYRIAQDGTVFRDHRGTSTEVAKVPLAFVQDNTLLWNAQKREATLNVLLATNGQGTLPSFKTLNINDPMLSRIFDNRLFDDVRSHLRTLPGARELAHAAFPAHVGLEHDLTSQAGDMVAGAQKALNVMNEMVTAMARKALELILQEFTGQRGPVTAKEVGDIGIVKDAAVVGQYLGSQRMYSAQEVLDVVYARISTYFVMMEQMVKEENDALTQANADAAARVHVPDPSEHVPNIAAIQAANAGTLTVAWVEMQGNIGSYSQEVRDSLTVAVAAAGFTDVAGETNAGTVQRGAALSSRSYLLSAESWTRKELILVNGERTDKEEIFIRPKSSFELTFTLERPSMVNFWAEPGLLDSSGGVPVNLDLVLSGTTTDGKSVRYSTTKSGGAGESISSVLPSGTYSLLVIDKTDYSQSLSDVQTLPSIKAPVGINIQKYNTANIEGQISIPERNETMPVSMSVAEFETNGKRNLNYDGSDLAKKSVNKLDSNKPVSVIIHGRANSEDSSQIAELVRNLQAQGIQVVTLDWHEGAEDNRTPISLEGSQWIVTVGTWAANQLKAAGFTGTNIDVIGHSWGSYVGYEIGAHIPGGVRTLVALDPAADTWLLGGEKYEGFSNPQFSFSIVAANSYAFHSSNFSNRNFALSAEYSFDVVAPENYENSIVGPLEIGLTMTQHYLAALGIEGLDEIRDAMNEHPFAISLFTELLKRQNGNPSDIAARAFSLENLRSNSPEFLVRPDNYEGTFFVNPTLVPNTIGSEAGQNVWKAINFGFRSKDATGNDIIQAQ